MVKEEARVIRIDITERAAWELKEAAAKARKTLKEFVLDSCLPSRKAKRDFKNGTN